MQDNDAPVTSPDARVWCACCPNKACVRGLNQLDGVLDQGRNRHIRRLLAEFDVAVLRLVRVAIGSLALGDIPKGQWRKLEREEVANLSPPFDLTA